MRMHVCVGVCMHVCVCVCVHVCVRAHACMCMCVCVQLAARSSFFLSVCTAVARNELVDAEGYQRLKDKVQKYRDNRLSAKDKDEDEEDEDEDEGKVVRSDRTGAKKLVQPWKGKHVSL